MLKKLKELPQKRVFGVGLTLQIIGLAINLIFPYKISSIVVGGTLLVVGTLLIMVTSNNKNSNTRKK